MAPSTPYHATSGLLGVASRTANRSAEPHDETLGVEDKAMLEASGIAGSGICESGPTGFMAMIPSLYLVLYPWMLIGAHQSCLSSQLPPNREALALVMRAGSTGPSSPAIARHLGPK